MPRRRTSRRGSMLAPQAFLAAMCVVLGLFPGVVLRRARRRDGVACRGFGPLPRWCAALFSIAPGPGHFDHLTPPLVALPVLLVVGLASALFLGVALRGEARADVGLRRRAVGADGVHGDRVLEAADDDLPRGLPADAGGARRWRRYRRTSRARCGTARRSSRPSSGSCTVPLTRGVLRGGRADEGDPGRQPPCLPRLRARARRSAFCSGSEVASESHPRRWPSAALQAAALLAVAPLLRRRQSRR